MRYGLVCGRAILVIVCIVAGACSSQAPLAPAPSAAAPSAPAVVLEQPFSGALSRWNYYRQAAGVPPVVADPALGEAARSHSKYLLKNNIPGADAVVESGTIRELPPNAGIREESPGNPWYTEAGEKAGRTAVIIRTGALSADGGPIVDGIISRGFNVLAMLDPQLAAVGLGQECKDHECVITVASKLGLPRGQFLALYDASRFAWNPALGDMPFTRARLRHPIFFPSPGVPAMASVDGTAWPDPQTSCGYESDSGAPITLQLGAPASSDDEVLLSSHSLDDNGVQVESCAFDGSSYKNPNGYEQREARWILHQYGAVMVLPRDPLKPGHTYNVSITADGTPYTWSFTVAQDAK